MNGAAPWRPPLRKYTPRIAGHTKSSSGLGLKRPVITKPKPFKQPVDLAKFLWVCLLVTLGVDCLLALALAGGQFLMPPTFFGTLAATTLLAIGIANGWALNSVRRSVPTWARDAFIGQVFVLFLAGYVIVTDVRSPTINWYVMVTAVLVLAVAFLWFIFLAPKSEFEWTKTALIVTALLPLAGLLQFWLQNYYIPSTSMPLVDISTELSPQGWSGPIIHLSAKATIHNRGTSAVNVAGSLIRVTAYPLMVPEETKFHVNPCWWTPARNEDWCRFANGFDPSGVEVDTDCRVSPTLPDLIAPIRTSASQLVYASSPASEFLMGGETDTYQRDVDIDSRKVLLTRLSVSAIFLTARRIEDIRSCVGKHASVYEDLSRFSSEVKRTQQLQPAGVHYFCREYDIAPGNFIEKLIANHPAMQVYTWLNNPHHYATEYPSIAAQFGTVGRFDQSDPRQQLERKLEKVYPASAMTSESEYAPTEKPLPSPAPAPPIGNG
jgi:heme/copper-type cytochrome/quinol oxidase subunit 4